jgi:preprotein translocase subunit SecD
MRALRLVAIGWAVAAVLLAGPWSVRPLGAQAPASPKWCLSFHAVHPLLTPWHAAQSGVPAGYRIVPSSDPRIGDHLVRDDPIVHAGDMADAQPGFDRYTNEPVIDFRLGEAGARRFGSFTRDNIGRPIAIVVAGRVVSAPVIREPILGGKGRISGSLTAAEAERLAARIRSGTCMETVRRPTPSATAAG